MEEGNPLQADGSVVFRPFISLSNVAPEAIWPVWHQGTVGFL